MSDLLVIFGAGASHDAYASDPCPPLTAGLFDEKHRAGFGRFTNVDGLRGTILSRVNRGDSLETVLREFDENPQEDIRRQMFDLPIYLKYILAQFDRRSASRYDDLITQIQFRSLSVTFVTLNYDMILDHAIEDKYGTTIRSMDGYIRENTTWKYVKLHGSVNWGYPTLLRSHVSLDGSRVGDYLRMLHNHGTPLDYDRSKLRVLEFPQWWSSEDALIYPALAIPTDRKGRFVCPPEHVEVLRETLRSDPAVLVIGNQGLDTDLMDVLRESARPRSSEPFHVVDPKDGMTVAVRFSNALQGRGFMPPKDDFGFGDFLESGDAERFLDDVVGRPRWN